MNWSIQARLELSENVTSSKEADKLFSNSAMAWATFGVYLMGLITCGFLGMVSVFERSGLAGPYRTVLNQLVSFIIDQAIIGFVIHVGICQLRQLWGPLPELACSLGLFVKIFTSMNMVCLLISITIVRFILICYYNSMPVMDDALIATFIYMAATLISFLYTSGKMYTDKNLHFFEVSL